MCFQICVAVCVTFDWFRSLYHSDVLQNLGKGSLWMVEQRFRPCLIQALQKAPHHQYQKLIRNLNNNNNNNSSNNNNTSSDSKKMTSEHVTWWVTLNFNVGTRWVSDFEIAIRRISSSWFCSWESRTSWILFLGAFIIMENGLQLLSKFWRNFRENVFAPWMWAVL